MTDLERIGSICQTLEEQCDQIVARFARTEADIRALRIQSAQQAAMLTEMERERDAAVAQATALRAQLDASQTSEQATRHLLHAQETALARSGLSGGFDEAWYLREYPDVRVAVEEGRFRSGLQHYLIHGHKEQRRQPMPPAAG